MIKPLRLYVIITRRSVPLPASGTDAAGWPRLSKARGSLRPLLLLTEARSGYDMGLRKRKASWPKPEPPFTFPFRILSTQAHLLLMEMAEGVGGRAQQGAAKGRWPLHV